MHFDNIDNELNANRKFHFLFARLLANTSKLIGNTYKNDTLDKKAKQKIILFALGSSLHMVQDFYAHSNWIHHDFGSFGKKFLIAEGRTPTYFEAVNHYGMKDAITPNFPFLVESGIHDFTNLGGYLPVTKNNIPKTHTHLCHDNTQLAEGKRKLARFHTQGAVSGLDSEEKHQQLAVITAFAGSIEWVELLSEEPLVGEAIRFSGNAAGNSFFLKTPAQKNVEGMKRSACMLSKWDGPEPTEREAKVCRKYRLSICNMLLSWTRGSKEGLLPSVTNTIWKQYIDANIIDKLTRGWGSPKNGKYDFSLMESY